MSKKDLQESGTPGGFIDDLKLVPASLISEVNDDNLVVLVEVAKEVQNLSKRPSYDSMRRLLLKTCSIRPFTAV